MVKLLKRKKQRNAKSKIQSNSYHSAMNSEMNSEKYAYGCNEVVLKSVSWAISVYYFTYNLPNYYISNII